MYASVPQIDLLQRTAFRQSSQSQIKVEKIAECYNFQFRATDVDGTTDESIFDLSFGEGQIEMAPQVGRATDELSPLLGHQTRVHQLFEVQVAQDLLRELTREDGEWVYALGRRQLRREFPMDLSQKLQSMPVSRCRNSVEPAR